MAHLSLYRKYRPQTFDEILGQEHISRTLANAIVEDRVAHAYLFTGPRGTGKTSTARILAKALNCEKGPTPQPCGECPPCVAIANGSSMDVIELDAASHSGVEDTREILQGVALATAGGRRKVYVIDEVHMLTTPSFNALLKTLEEPPPHVVFILATTEAHKVLQTIQSRTQRFDFRPIATEVLEAHLADVAAREGIEVEAAAFGIIARHAAGGARNALSTLDQLGSLGGTITAEDAERLLGTRDEAAFGEIFDAVAAGDLGGIFWGVHSLVARGSDVRQLTRGALEHARSLLLLKTAPDAGSLLEASDDDRAALAGQSERFSTERLLHLIDLLARALTEMREAPNHRLLLEVALVRAATTEAGPAAAAPPVSEVSPVAAPRRAGGPSAAPQIQPGRRAPLAAAPAAEATEPSATRPEPAAPPGRPAATPAEVGFAHFKDSWQAAVRELGRASKRAAALLNPSRPLDFADGTLTVEVQSQFHVDELSKERNAGLVADALQASVGVRPHLVFVPPGAPARGAEGRAAAPAEGAEIADIGETVPAEGGGHDPIELVRKGFAAEIVEERGKS